MTAQTTDRPHGYTRYKAGCRCQVCVGANNDYARNRYKRQAYGDWAPLVDATPAREHLRMLMAAGVSAKRIGAITGISLPTIGSLLGWNKNRPGERTRPETERKILTLDVGAALAEIPLADSIGTVRRIQALCAIGWSLKRQEQMAGRAPGTFTDVSRRPLVRAATAATVGALYDRMWDTPAPAGNSADAARRIAASRGWAPPMAWDDDSITDPAALPATAPGSGEGLLRAWLVNYQTLAVQGQSRAELAARLRMTPAAVKERLRRAQSNGWIDGQAEADEPKVTMACGTRAAYMRHRRRGEPVDQACRDANTAYTRAWAARQAVAA